jgi:AraC-like DNA-binding protein
MLCRQPDTGRAEWHTHDDHQLAWASRGVLTVITGDATWVLPPTRALWIPAGLPHETGAEGRATMRTLYIRPDLSPVAWTEPTPVAASQLLAELIGYLGGQLDATRRAHAEALLADLLTPAPMRLSRFACRPAAQPVRSRTRCGPVRTTSGRWRTGVTRWAPVGGRWPAPSRPKRACRSAAGGPSCGCRPRCPFWGVGQPVSCVADRVGYGAPSAFVAAFRRETGQTPAAYFRDPPGLSHDQCLK